MTLSPEVLRILRREGLDAIVLDAIVEEREACAKAADEAGCSYGIDCTDTRHPSSCAMSVAAVIRARGKETVTK